jgi:hypothetical protein
MIAFGPSSQLCLWGNSAPVPRDAHSLLTLRCLGARDGDVLQV